MSVLQSGASRRSAAGVIAGWWHQWTRTPACLSDLAACPEDEVNRMARDIGLSRHELQGLARRGPHAADLLFRRMAALDLNAKEVDAVERATFLDLERVCSNCDCKRRCKRDLARRADDAVWKDYCPNAGTLKMLDALPWSSRREW